jgi:ubiquinol-cytochrome c reductase core subunit 2
MSLFTRFARGSASKSLARTYATTVSEASGVKVAGYERGAPAGTVNLTVVVKAGSRYETRPGVAHVLKNFAFKVGSRCGVRLEQIGGLGWRRRTTVADHRWSCF